MTVGRAFLVFARLKEAAIFALASMLVLTLVATQLSTDRKQESLVSLVGGKPLKALAESLIDERGEVRDRLEKEQNPTVPSMATRSQRAAILERRAARRKTLERQASVIQRRLALIARQARLKGCREHDYVRCDGRGLDRRTLKVWFLAGLAAGFAFFFGWLYVQFRDSWMLTVRHRFWYLPCYALVIASTFAAPFVMVGIHAYRANAVYALDAEVWWLGQPGLIPLVVIMLHLAAVVVSAVDARVPAVVLPVVAGGVIGSAICAYAVITLTSGHVSLIVLVVVLVGVIGLWGTIGDSRSWGYGTPSRRPRGSDFFVDRCEQLSRPLLPCWAAAIAMFALDRADVALPVSRVLLILLALGVCGRAVKRSRQLELSLR